jgi:nucleotide-binding universal stress UspA family protein
MKRTDRTIVVGVAEMHREDPKVAPPGEDPVLAPAIALAERLGARLHVVRAFERPDPLFTTTTHAVDDGSSTRQRKSEIEEVLWAQVRRYSSGSRLHCHAVEGRADLQLCAFAEEVEADLLIVGATRRGWMWHNLLGSTAERVLGHATIPVLVIRRPFERPVRRVLLTTDMSDLSPALHEAALDTVKEVFGGEPLEVRTLLVCWYDMVTAARMSKDFMKEAAMSRLRQFLAERQRRSFPVVGEIRLGNPSTEIVRDAGEWQADLLVLGSHGHRGVSRLLLGSTSAATLQAASCNALVIPTSVAANWQPRTEVNRLRRQTTAHFPGTEEHTDAGVALMNS